MGTRPLGEQSDREVIQRGRLGPSPLEGHVPPRARTTPPPLPLLDRAMAELSLCLASLRVAEEALRVQNGILKESRRAREAEKRRCLELFAGTPDALLVMGMGGPILKAPAALLLGRCHRLLRYRTDQASCSRSFPHGSLYLQMRDELGTFFTNDDFVKLYPKRGLPALAPSGWL